MATPRLVEIAYFLIRREAVNGIAEKEVVRARERSLSRIDAQIEASVTDDDTGLPAWIAKAGIAPADGMSPFD